MYLNERADDKGLVEIDLIIALILVGIFALAVIFGPAVATLWSNAFA